MSKHAAGNDAVSESETLGTAVEALQSSPEFRGPAAAPDDHDHDHDHTHATNHLALVYESREEQFAAAIPFLRQGLERGERCLYITHETTREEVEAAMREYGIDVDAALASGALSIHDEAETYLRNGTFDADETIEFLESAIEEAAEEYAALRVTGEMSSVLAEDPEGRELVRCEAKANYLFEDVDGIALCQYDRRKFPSDVVRDVISTHPVLVHDGRVSHNVYYTPPEEFFGPEKADREVDRQLAALQEQTDAKTTLQERERYLRRSHEITSDPDRSFEEKLEALLELGRERFDLEIGYFTRTKDDDTFEIVAAVGDHEMIQPGVTDSVCDTYCEKLLASPGTISVTDAAEVGWTDDSAYERFGLDAYHATTVHVGGDEYGTLCFASVSPRERPYTDAERTFLDLMSQWVESELERQRRERFLQESYRITADPDRDFGEKVERLLALCREWMGLEAAGLTHLPSWDERFLNEYTLGYGSDDGETWTDPAEGTYCRQAIVADEPVGMADVRGTDWEDDEIHREHGLTCYLGTKITNGSTPYGTLWVGSTEPRDREFTETERTFLELMGRWVSYEIEREHREGALEESNERLEQFAYAASHDLQEPLRMVSSYLQLLERQYADAFDDEGREFLEFAVDGADRMRDMIDGLLKYSRVESRGDAFEPVDLEAIAEEVRRDLQFQIEERGAEITVGALPRVEGDASQLRQVLQNLLENALTYSGDDPPRVRIEATRRTQEWVVSVHDDGIGIDPDDQDRIFDIFDRLHGRDEYDGTGLGLALCERIVERHGGEIWVDSEPGEGSTFHFTLPPVDE